MYCFPHESSVKLNNKLRAHRFMKGRFMSGNLRLIQDVISYFEEKSIPNGLLFLDFEEAFD